MKPLLNGYGRALVALFVTAVAFWGLFLIILPQLTMFDQSLRLPRSQLDSSIAAALAADAQLCSGILAGFERDAAAPSPGALATPQIGIATPQVGTITPQTGTRPYVLQCDRATTAKAVVRVEGEAPATLDQLYGLPVLAIDPGLPIADQRAQAATIERLAMDLSARLEGEEARALGWSLRNFRTLIAPRAIPMTADSQAAEAGRLENQFYNLTGLRYVQDGVVYERLTLITLVRTIAFAMLATLLALVVCYPIAVDITLASTRRRAAWLLLALVIPYAIVELMRVYAWVAILDNNGVINRLLDLIGVLDIETQGYVQFKRYPLTIFVVIVYTYILFMMFPILNVMGTLDRNQIDAARDLGASTWRLHRRVIIPHTKPGIAVGCITTFMLAAGAFSVPRIISSGLQGEWFSQTIYTKFFESDSANAGAAYTFAYTLICFVIVGLFMRVVGARLRDFVR